MGRMALLLTSALALSAVSAVPAKADLIHHLIDYKSVIVPFCVSNNGTYWPDSAGHTYGCLWDDGQVIVCGGVTTAQKHSCTVTRRAPKGHGPTPPWFQGNDKR